MIKIIRYVNALGVGIILDLEHGYNLNKPDGIDVVAVSMATAQGIGQIGTTVQSKSIQPRPIVISGMICGADQDAKKEQLQAVIRPDLAGTLYADDWCIAVAVTSSPTIGARKRYAEFQFQLTAPYPFWQSVNVLGSQLTGVQNCFQFPWNISKPYRFGQRVVAQFAHIYNNGQVDCPMRVSITALDVAVNPKLENLLTGEFMLLEKSLAAGERIIVDITHSRTYVTSSVDGDCRGALTLDSNLYRLHVGDNVIKPTAQSGLDNLNIAIEFAQERVGITL